jgi:predicted transcriptional regulator
MRPKNLYIPEGNIRTGIDLTWTPRTQKLYIGVGLQFKTMSLEEFFRKLGITEKDVRNAFKEKQNG